jgi:hypothetical protein
MPYKRIIVSPKLTMKMRFAKGGSDFLKVVQTTIIPITGINANTHHLLKAFFGVVFCTGVADGDGGPTTTDNFCPH